MQIIRRTKRKMDSQAAKSRHEESVQAELFTRDTPETQAVPEMTPEQDDAWSTSLLILLLGLESVPGIGIKSLWRALDAGLGEAIRMWPAKTAMTAIRINELPARIRDLFDSQFWKDPEGIITRGQELAKSTAMRGIGFIPLGHRDYPASLRDLKDPPRWLFVQGDRAPLRSTSIVGVFGTREPSGTGSLLAYRCGEELAYRDIVVLSGLARGIDSQSHRGALSAGGKTIAVLGHGLLTRVSEETGSLGMNMLQSGGMIVSEYLLNDPPSRNRFLRRNEVAAALSQVLIPIEAPNLQSGTGATIRRAISLKRPIAGLFPKDTDAPSLIETRSQLLSLNLPVFELSHDNSHEFWKWLGVQLPNHQWETVSQLRERRWIGQIVSEFRRLWKEGSIDEGAIDNLTTELRNVIAQQPGQGRADGRS